VGSRPLELSSNFQSNSISTRETKRKGAQREFEMQFAEGAAQRKDRRSRSMLGSPRKTEGTSDQK
jgi:hypothetical protein